MVNHINTPEALEAFCGLNKPNIQTGLGSNSGNNTGLVVVVVIGVILAIGITAYLVSENKKLQVIIKKMKEEDTSSRLV